MAKSKLDEYFEKHPEQLEELKASISKLYVVEDTITGKKIVLPSFEAYRHQWSPDGSLWNPKRNDHIKIYPVEDLGPAAEVLFSSKSKTNKSKKNDP